MKIEDIIEFMDQTGMTDEELLQKIKQARFNAHLQQAAAAVASWPKWKQNLLGKLIETPDMSHLDSFP